MTSHLQSGPPVATVGATSAGAAQRMPVAGLPVDAAGVTQAAGVEAGPQAAARFDYPAIDATGQAKPVDVNRVTMLSDVNLRVKIELGRTRMLVEDVLRLGEGSVVELDKLAGDPVDVYANDRLVARGEVLVLDDSFCVRISEVVSRDPHRIVR